VLINDHVTEGRLVLADGQLAGVLMRLDGTTYDPATKGLWHLEAGFGKCTVCPGDSPLWRAPEDALPWMLARLRGP
jgi:hypothetical protein